MDDVIERLRRLDPVPGPLAPPPMDARLTGVEQQPRSHPALAAIRKGAAEPRSRTGRARARGALGHLPVLVALGTSLLVAALALVLIRHKQPSTPTTPSAGPPAASGPPAFPHLSSFQREQIDYVMKAAGTASRHDQACAASLSRLGSPGRKPSLSQASPSAAMLGIIGTLRRPGTPADHLPPRKIWNGPHSKPRIYPYGTYPAVEGIYERYIRYARHRDGANYYLVPAKNVNWQSPMPARCYHEQETALRDELPQIPRRLRSGIFALQSTYVAYERRSTAPYPGICLSALNDTGNGDGGSCYAVSQVEAGHTLVSGAPGGVPVVYGLAPDDVRSVTFYYRGRYPGHPLTALVINNVFILHDPQDRLPGNGFPSKLIWRAANGHRIKTITWR